ncbi:MAG TPA: hypothetical protein VGM37_01905 [Armatimonadota bacterium]|jgi:hypothetical protein
MIRRRLTGGQIALNVIGAAVALLIVAAFLALTLGLDILYWLTRPGA